MHRTATTVALALALWLPSVLEAQVRGSEPAQVSQTVDGTKVTVTYSRPRLRGRHDVFGNQVPWGEIWTPGANDATKLTVSKDVTIEGHAVPLGSYSVWIPMKPGEWTMVLDRDTTLFHESGPKERAGQIRFPVRKVAVPLTDVLTWSFTELKVSKMKLVMQWETTSVPLEIAVTPTQQTAVDPALGRRLEGRYEMRFKPAPPPKDPSVTAVPTMPERVVLTVWQDGRLLRARMDPPMWPGLHDFLVLRKSDDVYMLAEAEGDEIRDMWDWEVLEFKFADGKATGFEMRLTNDEVEATGTRMR